jgi:dienelactone hydrolase
MKKIGLILIFCFATFALSAQVLTAMRDSVPGSYNFWFYEPPVISNIVSNISNDTSIIAKSDTIKNVLIDETIDDLNSDTIYSDSIVNSSSLVSFCDSASNVVTKPLVVFLHGKSLSGKNLQIVRRYGTISALEMGLDLDAYVIAPQTNNGWNPQRVWKMVDWATQRYPIDTTRIYVLGMSMGGYGTIDLAATYPDKIAAAIALCGGAMVDNLCGLNNLPLWIIHGTADKKVSVKCSDRVVSAMVSCGDTTRLRYDRLKDQNHSILARVFYMNEAYDWLQSHSLNDSARVLNRDYSITTNKFASAYKHLHGKRAHITMIDGRKQSDTYSSSVPKQVHVVKQGDTLSAIAQRYGTTVSKLCQLNGISKTSILRIGQKIKIS